MSRFILKINQISDPLPEDEAIVCYAADASLADDFLTGLNNRDKMLLLFGPEAADRCKQLQADGVLFEPDPKLPLKVQVKKVRANIGERAVLGLIIPPRRHEAMLAAETEPAFVAFKYPAEDASRAEATVKWYNELFLIQSALDLESDVKINPLPEADFIIINSSAYADFSC